CVQYYNAAIRCGPQCQRMERYNTVEPTMFIYSATARFYSRKNIARRQRTMLRKYSPRKAGARSSRNAQQGFILSAEAMLLVTILVLGTVMGWVTIRDAANAELIDVANVIESVTSVPYFSDPDRGADLGEPAESSFDFCVPSPEEA